MTAVSPLTCLRVRMVPLENLNVYCWKATINLSNFLLFLVEEVEE